LGLQTSQYLPIHAAWAILYIAYYLLDKVEDGETDHPLFISYGTGTVTNLTTGLILHAQRMLVECAAELQVDETALNAVQTAFNQKALAVCAGQHLDLTHTHPSLAEAWEIAGAKSGDFFSLAGFLGARLATDDATIVDAFARFGWRLGVVIQIANDIQGLGRGAEVGGDLSQRKWTLPSAYALHILPPNQRDRLQQLLEEAPENRLAEIEARKQIIGAGALTYLALEVERFRYQAMMDLNPLGKPVQPLLTMLQRTIDTRDFLRRAQPGVSDVSSTATL
jgi:geranylgeranyl pyrophosphate synthase